MSYVAFDVCTVRDCGQQRRGARATCGHCGVVNTVAVNTFSRSGDDDGGVIEKHVAQKFEKLGWKIGKTANQNRCPGCFSAIKIAATRKRSEREAEMNNKVVPINTPAIVTHERPMTRDERYLIFKKIDEYYAGEKVGYVPGWNDGRVAADLGVPRVWVTQIRDEMIGPDISEETAKTITEAKALLSEIREVGLSAEPIVRQLHELATKAEQIEQALKEIGSSR